MIAAVGLASRPCLLAHLDVERVMDALQRAVPVPQRQGSRAPCSSAAGPSAGPSTGSRSTARRRCAFSTSRTFTSRGRPPRLAGGISGCNQRPLGVRQIARVAQAAPVGRTAVFGLPHRAPLLAIRVPDNGITTDSTRLNFFPDRLLRDTARRSARMSSPVPTTSSSSAADTWRRH